MRVAPRLRWSVVTVVPVLLWGPSCVETEESEHSLSLEDPRSSGGVVVADPRDDRLEQWFEQQDARSSTARSDAETSAKATLDSEAAPELPDATTAVWPADSGQMKELPRLSRTELTELLDALDRRLRSEKQYRHPTPDELRRVPALPEGIAEERVLVRNQPDGLEAIRFGYWLYRSRAPQLLVRGGNDRRVGSSCRGSGEGAPRRARERSAVGRESGGECGDE